MAQTIQQAVQILLGDTEAHRDWEGEDIDVRCRDGVWRDVKDYFLDVDLSEPSVTLEGVLNGLDDEFATFRLRGVDGDPEVTIPRERWDKSLKRAQNVRIDIRIAE